MTRWINDPLVDDGIIISSRIRLARNAAKYPFQITLADTMAEAMMAEVADALFDAPNPLAKEADFFKLSDLSESERRVMFEQQIISHTLYKSERAAGIVKRQDGSVSVLLNEEDHIRIQSVAAGARIHGAWERANLVDDAIEARMAYAFDKEFGYLTTCPTNTGTGLRASFMVHLPMLDKTEQLKNIVPALGKFGMTVRGFYGEGTEPFGSVFQISNQLTLGKSEPEIIKALQNITKQVTDNEARLLAKALEKDKTAVEDNVYRSYGILANARTISSKEALGLLSNIRLGFMTGILNAPKPTQTVISLMMNCQPGTMEARRGAAQAAVRDRYRAEYLRKALQN